MPMHQLKTAPILQGRDGREPIAATCTRSSTPVATVSGNLGGTRQKMLDYRQVNGGLLSPCRSTLLLSDVTGGGFSQIILRMNIGEPEVATLTLLPTT
ncbi:hypothetical protein SODALDRAFT_354229 [Sodiomyces alkalinus F11]|uniref:Uncharacterized protein n=1 Tax=Sodiomyces alkalinus (strain CBS 110278 / VKM F-3762 / F11) TaxID=1314773 RepID=A0A3N2Q5U3_SODAK|nr:hypothetical protein SODALDRAFT_354229 [Sodiomyces alkalinus F11]ROT42110.1 hypothetical protein SODALDRAFT_354229 [Sodiomyces alkalinus F11]